MQWKARIILANKNKCIKEYGHVDPILLGPFFNVLVLIFRVLVVARVFRKVGVTGDVCNRPGGWEGSDDGRQYFFWPQEGSRFYVIIIRGAMLIDMSSWKSNLQAYGKRTSEI